MKKNEVKVGQTYRVKVSGSIVDVRITGENPHGGWDAINVATNRKVRIKSAQRLRGLAQRPVKRKKIVSLAEYEAETKAPSAKGAKKGAKATTEAKPATERDTGERGDVNPLTLAYDGKKLSGLDAAAKILALGSALPMRCGDIVKIMIDRGYWKTNGKTPAATVYAAITREIATKGEAARFRKVERGKFELAK